jgi:hypothetical protein
MILGTLAIIAAVLIPHLVFADDLTDAINAERARHGLHALVHEPSLVADAAINNRYGFGHTYLGRAERQCAAWGQPTVEAVAAAWIASPPHRAILLARDLTCCGGAFSNGVWTCNFSTQPNQAAGTSGVKAPPTLAATAACSTPQCRPAAAPPRTRHGNLAAGVIAAPASMSTEGPFRWLGRRVFGRSN